jgi:hypothetical protein
VPSAQSNLSVQHLIELGYEDPLDVAVRRRAELQIRAAKASTDATAWRRHYRERNWAGAAERALNALASDFSQPMFHCRLGLALSRMHKRSEAIAALETSLKLKPDCDSARRILRRLRAEGSG